MIRGHVCAFSTTVEYYNIQTMSLAKLAPWGTDRKDGDDFSHSPNRNLTSAIKHCV